MTEQEQLLHWASGVEVELTRSATEISTAFAEAWGECEPTRSSGYSRISGREEGRIIASLRHEYTNYETLLHELAGKTLTEDGAPIDALADAREEAHGILRRRANDAIRDAC